jgi:hypothetical protein|tara:strand:+ start:4625 stop:5044 length:420 start_codon:yes stop_codon:yes gene_type:complete
MGTRSTTHILDENGNRLLCIYQQFDGYIEGGVGEKLIRLLEDRVVVNGYTMEDKERRNFNGMSCLAADVVAHFKDGIGGAYIQALDEDYVGSYDYTISCIGDGKDSKPQRLKIKMQSYGEVVYDGLIDDFDLKLVVGLE